jgi:hypothetical protein
VDQRAIQDHVGVTGRFRCQQRPVQGWSAGREYRDALIPVVIRRRQGDGVVGGQSGHSGVVEEPAQYQDGLLVGSQGAPSLAGAASDTLGVQQTGQEQDAVLGYVEDGGVCDTHQAQNLCEVDLGRTTFIQGFCVFLLYRSEFGVSPAAMNCRYAESPMVTRNASMGTRRMAPTRAPG